MLRTESLSVMRGGRVLAENLSLSLEPGTVLRLDGANGSGKTTLLRTLAGLSAPAKGRVLWGGEPIADEYRKTVLYLGHQPALKPELTVAQNLEHWARMKAGHVLLVAAALHYFGLVPFAHLPAGKLSAGWQRKAALARLLAIPASVWLLDEPFSNLDAHSRALLLGLIATRASQGGIVVMAAHGEEGEGAQVLRMADFAPRPHEEEA